jgi:hypothetical protein
MINVDSNSECWHETMAEDAEALIRLVLKLIQTIYFCVRAYGMGRQIITK